MKRRVPLLPLSAALAIFLFVSGGCAQNQQALRPEEAGMAVRTAPAADIDVRLGAERPESPPQLPLTVTDEMDEMRVRWLTLFKVTVSPVGTGTLPGNKPLKE